MNSDDITKKQADHLKYAGPSVRTDDRYFRLLSYELLKLSTRGLLRRDFLPKVAEMIRKHCGCEVTEIWVKEGSDKHFRCTVSGLKKMPFGFILVPCPLGDETDASLDDTGEMSIERVCCEVIKGRAAGLFPQVTKRGSCWDNGAEDVVGSDDPAGQTSVARVTRRQGYYKSRALIPIQLEGECVGLLQLKSQNAGFFAADDIGFFEDISAVLGIALSHQYAHIELRERIKELTCLYGIARVIAQPESSLDEIIQGIVDLLPPAWLYPEIASARIVLNDREYTTDGYRETPYRLVSDIIVNRQKIGFAEVAYREIKLTLDEGPFLSEERKLLDSVAREIANFFELTKGEKEKTLLQDQLRHADRLATIGQLAAGVAHELNEPLGNILGLAELARKSPDLPAQLEKDLEDIEAASLHGREIIKKLMTFARQLPPQKVLVNLNDVVSNALYFFEARCAKAAIEIEYRLFPDLPKITVDPGQIQQVLVNLVVNAIQAMPGGGVLTVETRAVDGGARLSVGDTGEGINDENKSQVFLPFFSTKDVNEGTGLGLAVVHGIIHAHGGEVTFETTIGKGARFDVYLPLAAPNGSERMSE